MVLRLQSRHAKHKATMSNRGHLEITVDVHNLSIGHIRILIHGK